MYERGTIAPMMIRWSGSGGSDILNHAVVNDFVLSRETYSTLAKLADIQLSDAQRYGADFSYLLKNHLKVNPTQESPSYVNNFRSEWITSPHRPVFYENNVDNHPHRTYVDTSSISQCADTNGVLQNLDGRGEYQHFATQQHLWKHVYHSSFWQDHNGYGNCTPFKSELFAVAGTESTVPNSNPPSTYTQYELVDQSLNQPHVVKYLELLRKRWYQGMGKIEFDYEPLVGSAILDSEGNVNITGGGGYASLGESERYNSSDGNFTFSTFITPNGCRNLSGLSGVIAERQNSWLLETVGGQIKLKVFAEGIDGNGLVATETYNLDSGAHLMACNAKNHVAFTLLGGRKGGPLVRLFLNGQRVGTQLRTDATILPSDPNGEWLTTDLDRLLVFNSGSKITLGVDPMNSTTVGSSSLIANYERPKMYVTSFSNEDMIYQGADRLNRTDYENTKVVYSTVLNNRANQSNPIYHYVPASPLPTNGENSVVALTAVTGQNFGVSNDQEFSFSGVVKLNGTQPYGQTVIAKQTSDTNTGGVPASWILKLKEHITVKPNQQPVTEYQLKLNIISDNASCGSQTLSADSSAYFLPGETVQVGFNYSHGKVRLFFNGQIIDEKTFKHNGNACSVAAGKNVYLGNKYQNCQTLVDNNPNDPVSKYCQMLDGTIEQVEMYPTPQYHTALINNVTSAADIIAFNDVNALPTAVYPYAALSGDFDVAVNGVYNFATVANVLDETVGSHATLGRQTYTDVVDGVETEKASWILKYISTGSYPSSEFNVKLNIWMGGDTGVEKLTLENPAVTVNSFEEHHWAIKVNNNQVYLYLDGVQFDMKSCNDSACRFVGGDQITLGAQKASGCGSFDPEPDNPNTSDVPASGSCHPFTGYIYNPRIWTSNQTDEAYMQWDARYNYKY